MRRRKYLWAYYYYCAIRTEKIFSTHRRVAARYVGAYGATWPMRAKRPVRGVAFFLYATCTAPLLIYIHTTTSTNTGLRDYINGQSHQSISPFSLVRIIFSSSLSLSLSRTPLLFSVSRYSFASRSFILLLLFVRTYL